MTFRYFGPLALVLAWVAAGGRAWAAGRAIGPLDAKMIKVAILDSPNLLTMPPALVSAVRRLNADSARDIAVLQPIFSSRDNRRPIEEVVRMAVTQVQRDGAELERAARAAARSGQVEELSNAIAGMRRIFSTYSMYLSKKPEPEAIMDLPRLQAAYERAHEEHRRLLSKKIKSFISRMSYDRGRKFAGSPGLLPRQEEDAFLSRLVDLEVDAAPGSRHLFDPKKLPPEKIRELAAAIHDHRTLERSERSGGFAFDTGKGRVYLYRELRLLPAFPNP